MRRTLPVRSSLGTARINKVWVILIIVDSVAIIVLAIFAAIVYDRIKFELFSPPVFSIWLRPGETWHLAEFATSPSFGFEMTFDGRTIFNYRYSGISHARRQEHDRWNTEDRPRLVASYLAIPKALDKYHWIFVNNGKDDATNVSVKIAAVDLNHVHHTLLTTPRNVFPRLKQGGSYLIITEPENDLQFIIVCMTYSNDRGTDFVDLPQFYLTPFHLKTNQETRSEPARVTALLSDQLSASFSCADV